MGWGIKIKSPKVSLPRVTIGPKIDQSFKKAVGDVGKTVKDTAAKGTNAYVDVMTMGQANKVDAVTGGAASSLKGAYRGNLKDITRIGATVGATAAGGPAAGLAVNSAFASGGNVLDAGAAYAGSQYGDGAGSIATNIANNFNGRKTAAQATDDQGSPYTPAPMQSSSSDFFSKNKVLIMGAAGSLLLVILLIFGMKKR